MNDSYWSKVTSSRLTRRRALAAGSSLALSAAFLAACGGGDDEDGSSEEPSASSGTSSEKGIQKTADGLRANAGGTPVQGGRLTNYIGSPAKGYNVILDTSEGAYYGGQHVYDRLLSTRVATDKPYVLEAAESFEQPDDLKLIFKLKPNMVFQSRAPVSGRAVKASDVVGTQNLVKSLDGADNPFQRTVMDKVEAPDDRTVVFTFKAPNAYLFSSRMLGNATSQALIPAELHDSMKGAGPEWPIGSGPYEQVEGALGSRYLYKRFERFREVAKKLPYINEREMLTLTDVAAQEASFRADRIHVWNPPAARFDQLATELSSKAIKIEASGLASQTWVLGMYTGRGPWTTDPRIRQGLYRATNREQIKSIVFAGKGVIPPGVLSTGQTAYQLDPKDTAEYFKFDPAEGKRLLSAAGFSGTFGAMVGTGNAVSEQLGQVLKQQFAEVGAGLQLQPVTLGELVDRSIKGEYDMYIGGHPAYDTPQVPLRQNHKDSRSQFANSGLGDPEIDKLIEKSEQTLKFEDNVKLVKQIQLELLKKYTSYYNILTPAFLRLLNAKVHNWDVDPSSGASTIYYLDAWLSA